MQLFLDTANVDEIRKAAAMGVLSGVTTNPTLVAREGRDLERVVVEICSLVDGPVSAEVLSQDTPGMIEEARRLAAIHPNVVVKIPITPEGLQAVSRLTSEGIKINVTLVFAVNQALLAARAGATFVSPFVGRLDDIGHDGMALVEDIVQVLGRYQLPAKVIAASIRHPLHVAQAAKAGAHIATIPYGILMQMVRHPLTDAGIERFLRDWEEMKRQ